MLRSVLVLHLVCAIMSYTSPFHHWHCIDFKKNMRTDRPYAFNVGELSLITWFDKDEPKTMLNICKVQNNSLVCPLHGIHHSMNDTFGTTMIFEDKIWWSYEPIKCKPSSTPFYNHANYETITMKIDIHENVKDCLSHVFACIYKHHKKECKYFQVFDYPYRLQSMIFLHNQKKIIVDANMLPLGPKETQCIVTLKHNVWKSCIGKMKLEYIIASVLMQHDKHKKMPKNEQHFVLKNYHYPDMIDVMKLLMFTI